jgi:hypothetical protein
MNEADWSSCTNLRLMLDYLDGRLSDRQLRLFAVACCRTVWGLLRDEAMRRPVQIAERMADGQAKPGEQREVLQVIGSRVNREYGVFLCGGSEGSGTTYAAMAAVATLDPALRFTWYMGQTPSETHAAWDCVAMARAQTAKQAAREKRWQEWCDLSPDPEEEPDEEWYERTSDAGYDAWDRELAVASSDHCVLLRDIVGPFPFRDVFFCSSWRSSTARAIAQSIYVDPADHRHPILADALEEAGCTNADILSHCRQPGKHVKGCWVVDLLLHKGCDRMSD